MTKVRGAREKMFVFLEDVGFTFDYQAKMWLADSVTKCHV
jgi:hypothetical protein